VYYLIADNELAKQVDPAEGMDLPDYFGGISADDATDQGDEATTEETQQ